MSKIKSSFLLKSLLFVTIIGIAWWAYTQLDYRIEKIDKGYQGEALINPYLAAEYFLRNMGQSSEQINLFASRQKKLKTNDTLLIPGNRISFDKRRSNDILKWVKQGGHLVITGKPVKTNGYESHDNILDRLDLMIEWKINEGESLEEDLPLDLDVIDEENFWQVDFVDYQVIEFKNNIKQSEFRHEIVWTIENDNKIHGIQLKLGEGHLTLLSDLKMFRNEFIDHYDHAVFLFSLSNVQTEFSNPGTFYYSTYEEHISLYQWLWDNARPFMLSLFIVVTLVLWMLIPRFGPIINTHQPVRRRFLDHLTAAGNYHWRQGNYSLLLHEERKQLSVQMQLKYPEWINLSKNDQLNHLSDISHLQMSVIEKALFDMKIEQLNDFVNKIKILEKLRKSL